MTVDVAEFHVTRDSAGLVVDGLRVQFGGLVAVDDLHLEAPVGRITGLIGPNGAGKSTTFDSCSGFNQPAHGRISFAGVELTGAPPVRRAQVGIGRTFQRIELFDSLTVRTNVAMGREARFAGRSPLTQLWTKRSERADVEQATDEALELCGLDGLADVRAGALSTGQRRLVELARALCGGHRLLLLDEPSSGLDPHESKEFGRLLRLAVEKWGTGILVVEHDMSLIAAVCDYVYVLDFGKLIFEGSAAEVLGSDVVRIAYLGTEPIPEVEG
jgi:ABC-type branched-subunit amino acid transport system ATPase component